MVGQRHPCEQLQTAPGGTRETNWSKARISSSQVKMGVIQFTHLIIQVSRVHPHLLQEFDTGSPHHGFRELNKLDKRTADYYIRERGFRTTQDRSTGWTEADLQTLRDLVLQCKEEFGAEDGARRLVAYCYTAFQETKSHVTIRHGIRILDRRINTE